MYHQVSAIGRHLLKTLLCLYVIVCVYIRVCVCVQLWPLLCGGDQAGSGCTGFGLASQKEGYPCTQFMQCIHFMQHKKDQAVMSLTHLPATWHTGPKFNTSNWLLSVPWPGGWCISWGGEEPAAGQVMKGVCVYVCVCVRE